MFLCAEFRLHSLGHIHIRTYVICSRHLLSACVRTHGYVECGLPFTQTSCSSGTRCCFSPHRPAGTLAQLVSTESAGLDVKMSHLLLLNVRPVPQAATFSKETIDRYYGPCTDWTRADLILDAVDAEDYGEEREQPETTAIVANLQPGSNRYFRTRCNAVPQVLCLPFLLRYLFAGWYEHVQEVKARIYEAVFSLFLSGWRSNPSM